MRLFKRTLFISLGLLIPCTVLAQDICGDNVRQGDEECDGPDLSAVDCTLLGFDGGVLSCSVCTFDTGGCYRCGDGTQNPTEACDGLELGEHTCLDEGFVGGDLRCHGDCTIDTSDCHLCGNGVVDEGEDCDANAPGGLTCVDFGFDGGRLGCGERCTADTSECSDDLCGNGFADPGEDCDSEDLKDETCLGLGFDGGVLSCTRACTFGVTACEGTVDRLCGNGTLEVGEECDGENLGDASCVSLGFDEGELTCNPACVLSLLGCSGSGPDAGRPDTGLPSDVEVPLPYEDAFGGGPQPTGEVTPITIGCCGVEGGEPVEPDPAALSWGVVVLGFLVRRRRS